jgi:hypothetical protein
MRGTHPPALLPLAALLAAGLAALPAVAAEREWQAAGSLDAALARADGRWTAGGGFGLEGRYGLTDAFAARAELDGSWHPTSADGGRPGGTVRVGGLTAGLGWALDVLRFVPFAELGLALQALGGAVAERRVDLGLEAGAGLEYLLDRRWSLGLALRARWLPVRLAGDDGAFGGTPACLRAALRLGYAF